MKYNNILFDADGTLFDFKLADTEVVYRLYAAVIYFIDVL